MIRIIWTSVIALGVAAGAAWAGPPGHGGGGHAGGHGGGGHPGGAVHHSGGGGAYHGGGSHHSGVSIGIGLGGGGYGGVGFGYSNYGRGVGIGLSVPLYGGGYSSGGYYPAQTFGQYYSQPAAQAYYPPVQYVPSSSALIRSPMNAPGGTFLVPPLADPNPPTGPPAIPPADPLDRNPGPFRYDGGPVNPIPLPAPDAQPPAPMKPPGDGIKVSLPGPVVKAGYAYPAYGGK